MVLTFQWSLPVTQPLPFETTRGSYVSQNCLFICNYDICFKYTLTGWEGSASDSRVYDNTLSSDLNIPEGKYILANLGYSSRPILLVPYCDTCYHLAEWGWVNVWYALIYFFLQLLTPCSPENKEELFNLHYISLQNAIEHIFGILKRCF